MDDEQTSSDTPCLEESDPTNAKLAALMVEQTGVVLRNLAHVEKLVADLMPKPVEIANQIDDALREDAALAEVLATLIPDGEPMAEIPEGWAPVVLAINPMTGEFLTVAGPRSGPDGRVEAVETMLARQMTNAVRETLGAVREAGRPQPKPRDEARPQPKPGEPDYEEESEE